MRRLKPSTIARLFLLVGVFIPSWFVHIHTKKEVFFGGTHPTFGLFIVAVIVGAVLVTAFIGLLILFVLALTGQYDR